MQCRWTLTQDLEDGINYHRLAYVYSSKWIFVDEFISSWYGLSGNWIGIRLAHYVAIERKPEKGCEIQNSASGQIGSMFLIELLAPQEEPSRRMSEGEQKHDTVVLWRLSTPWAGSGRVLCVEFWYDRVCTAETLQRMALELTCVIKTAKRLHPMSHLSGQELCEKE